jgi:hypothetical protein
MIATGARCVGCTAMWATVLIQFGVGCGGGTAAAEHPAAKSSVEPLAWQRAVRAETAPGKVFLVYHTVLSQPPLAWTLKVEQKEPVVTLLARPVRRHERLVLIVACVTVRSPALAGRRRIKDGAVAGKSASVRRQFHSRDQRRSARSFDASSANCPVLPRR